jgi:hypothetical protein
MFVQAKVVLEEAAAWNAADVFAVVVVLQFVVVVEEFVTLLAVGMGWGLDVVLFESSPSLEIDIAVLAPVVVGRGTEMLAVGGVQVVVEVTAATVDHDDFLETADRRLGYEGWLVGQGYLRRD